MAATALNKPGTEYGPCENENCGHRDCAETRKQAAQPCTICGEPIGYNRPHYRDNPEGVTDWSKLAHAVCYEEAVERGER